LLNTWAKNLSNNISVSADGPSVERGIKAQATNFVASKRGWYSGVTVYHVHWNVKKRGEVLLETSAHESINFKSFQELTRRWVYNWAEEEFKPAPAINAGTSMLLISLHYTIQKFV